MLTRRKFNNIIAFIPFIGTAFKNKNIDIQDLNEELKNLSTFSYPRVLIMYHDIESAIKIVQYLKIRPFSIDLSGSSSLTNRTIDKTVIFSFHKVRPKSNTFDPIFHNNRVTQEARYSQLTLLQDEKSHGKFTIIKSRYTQKGRVFNVFDT